MHKNNDQAGQQAPIQSAELVAKLAEVAELFLPNCEPHKTLIKAIDALAAAPAQQQASTASVCVCGEPLTLGTVHRADGPCYTAEAAPAHALTDAEIDAIAIEFEDYSEDESSYFDHRKFARAIAAHLALKG